MKTKTLPIIGFCGLLLFVILYGIEVFPHHGPPATIQWVRETLGQTGLIVLNILIVLAFLALLPYRRPTKNVWKSQTPFIAFAIALMTEMFGWPLLLFLIAPLVDIPIIAGDYFAALGHWPASVGTALSILGIVLIGIGWLQIHRAERLVTTGLYRYMRHPQYTGIILFTFGWILHWPSVITLLLWPVLIGAYVWLAKKEEGMARDEFGGEYERYAAQTKRFIPGLI